MRSPSPEMTRDPAFSIEEINGFLSEGWRFVERDTKRLGRVAFLDPIKHRPSPFPDADAVYLHVARAALAGSDPHRRALKRVREICPDEWEAAREALDRAGISAEAVSIAADETFESLSAEQNEGNLAPLDGPSSPFGG